MHEGHASRREAAVGPANLAFAAAAAAPLASPRVPRSRGRRVGEGSPLRSWLIPNLCMLLATLAILTPGTAPIFCVCAPAAALVLLLLDDERALMRPASAWLLPLGGALTVAMIVYWLAKDSEKTRVLLFAPWIPIAALLRRGVGTGAPRLLLWVPTMLLLAAVLLWVNLLATIQWHPTNRSQIDVVAGWPWPSYVGAIRNRGTPGLATAPAALWLDYAGMLALAAMLSWRRPTSWLIRWLPRLCALLAILHGFGGFCLALAADG